MDRPLHPKPLLFSDHAADRMRERGFTVEDVKRLLYLGAVAKSSYQPPGGPFRHARQLILRGRPAKVIFLDEPTRYLIVTVEWVYEP